METLGNFLQRVINVFSWKPSRLAIANDGAPRVADFEAKLNNLERKYEDLEREMADLKKKDEKQIVEVQQLKTDNHILKLKLLDCEIIIGDLQNKEEELRSEVEQLEDTNSQFMSRLRKYKLNVFKMAKKQNNMHETMKLKADEIDKFETGIKGNVKKLENAIQAIKECDTEEQPDNNAFRLLAVEKIIGQLRFEIETIKHLDLKVKYQENETKLAGDIQSVRFTAEENARNIADLENIIHVISKDLTASETTNLLTTEVLKVLKNQLEEMISENSKEAKLELKSKSETKTRISTLQMMYEKEFEKVYDDFTKDDEDQLKYFYSHVHTWKIENAVKKLKNKKFLLLGNDFQVTSYKFSARAFLKTYGGQVYVGVKFLDPDNNYPEGYYVTDVNVYPSFTFILKDLSKSNEPKDIVRIRPYDFGNQIKFNSDNMGPNNEILLCDFSGLKNSIVYNRDYTIVIEVLVELPSIAISCFSIDGILMAKVCKYKKKREAGISKRILYTPSHYFYDSVSGRRLQVRMWLNGHNELSGTNLTATLNYLEGTLQHDASSLPVLHTVTFTIFNQVDPTNHKIIVDHYDFSTDSQPREFDLGTFSEIENKGFLKGDCLFYKVIVDVH